MARREAVGGGEVVGDFTALGPHAGVGRAEQGAAGDADDGLDEGLPLGRGQGLADGKDFDGSVLLKPEVAQQDDLKTLRRMQLLHIIIKLYH